MGDGFQVIVDLEATLEETTRLAKVVADALQAERIVGPHERRDPSGMQGGDALAGLEALAGLDDRWREWKNRVLELQRSLPGLAGHPPGTAAESAVEDPEDFTGGDTGLFERLEVIARRQVRGESEESPISIACPSCGASEKDMRAWADAVADWQYSGGEGSLQCRACGARTPVHRWNHEPLWVYGNLGLVFWNWPELRQDFIEKISKLLGHRVAVVRGTF